MGQVCNYANFGLGYLEDDDDDDDDGGDDDEQINIFRSVYNSVFTYMYFKNIFRYRSNLRAGYVSKNGSNWELFCVYMSTADMRIRTIPI